MIKRLLIIALMAGMVLAETTDNYVPVEYTGDGSTVDFSFSFPVEATADIEVILKLTATEVETVLTEIADYTVTAVNLDFGEGGTVTTVSTYESTQTITIRRATDKTQDSDFVDTRKLDMSDIEGGYDKLTRLVQEQQEEIDRCLKIPKTDNNIVLLPQSIDRQDQWLYVNTSGDISTSNAVLPTTAAVSTYGESFIDDASEAAFKATTNLESGTDVQAWDTQLDDIAALAVTNSNFIVGDGSNWVAESGATARASMGLVVGTDVQAYDALLADIAAISAATKHNIIIGNGSNLVSVNMVFYENDIVAYENEIVTY